MTPQNLAVSLANHNTLIGTNSPRDCSLFNMMQPHHSLPLIPIFTLFLFTSCLSNVWKQLLIRLCYATIHILNIEVSFSARDICYVNLMFTACMHISNGRRIHTANESAQDSATVRVEAPSSSAIHIDVDPTRPREARRRFTRIETFALCSSAMFLLDFMYGQHGAPLTPPEGCSKIEYFLLIRSAALQTPLGGMR